MDNNINDKPSWAVLYNHNLNWDLWLQTITRLMADLVCHCGIDPAKYPIFKLTDYETDIDDIFICDSSINNIYNAETAKRLEHSVKINGIDFDGSKDINIYSKLRGSLVPDDKYFINVEPYNGEKSVLLSLNAKSGLGDTENENEINNTIVIRDGEGSIRVNKIYANAIIGLTFEAADSVKNPIIPGDYIVGEAFDGHLPEIWSVDATPNATPRKVVARDIQGNFKSNEITVNKILFNTNQSIVNNAEFNVSNTDPTLETRLNCEAHLHVSKISAGSYNDIAECFEREDKISDMTNRIVEVNDEGKISLSSKHSDRVIGVVSDSYGFLLYGTEDEIKNKTKSAIAMSGTVNVQSFIKTSKNNIGKFIASDDNGCADVLLNGIIGMDGKIVGKIIKVIDDYTYRILVLNK
jgi:exosome complex RNA-binding protein Csl4